MTAFYTRGGDEGFTGLLGEGRVPKYDAVMEALGAVDEANACLGVARSICPSEEVCAIIKTIQRHLYGVMAEVAATPQNAGKFQSISAEQVAWLEAQTAWAEQLAPPPKEFILPGDSAAGAAFDLARTVVRRAERRVVELAHKKWVQNPELLRYLNRLSSLIFVLELYANQLAGVDQSSLAKDAR